MSAGSDGRPFDWLERASLWLASLCMIAMTLLMLTEIVLRGVFDSTTDNSDELVGYLLVGVSFLSLALCQSRGAFHRVEIVQMRLGARGRAVSALIFDLLSFAYIALTDWYFIQFVMSSYRREAVASTPLATPLWIPEMVMILGASMLLLVLARAILNDLRGLAT
ncbi:TRAP-type C4-dicarboxylate transport system, small permease component [Enhydrobacter aerosaccus]|uniref:TRAP transporter small permease protein n=1 Tax=Enhydrobacter aerosaccus TaxID=225324 RepID=A0A1T4T2I4_9HYPH|nr:TRAP transporter small permease [Enhydrobacter aerosaccus]SKA34740.1 TRAP-type C4-dicarboxylate transport system, small permease component [Enhydrobacter aerosaccus]